MKAYIKARQSLFIAVGVSLLLILWMLSGQLPSQAQQEPQAEQTRTTSPLVRVRVRDLQAETISREIIVSGRTEPKRAVVLRAEVDGRVVEVVAEKGALLKQGDLIARLDPRDHAEQLAQAQANQKEQELRYAAAKRLRTKDYQTETELAAALAQLEAARAEVKRRALALENTEIRAPFAGVLDARPVEVGTYIQAGDEVARVLETEVLRVRGDVTEQEVQFLHNGAAGSARLVTGQTVEGEICFVGSDSDGNTRTYPVELEIDNTDGAVAAGVTAEIRVRAGEVRSHFVSPALLALDELGRVGVKGLDAQDRVEFYVVEIVRSNPKGLWVTGLPDPVRVITVGQGYVRAGEQVKAVPEAPAISAAGLEPTTGNP